MKIIKLVVFRKMLNILLLLGLLAFSLFNVGCTNTKNSSNSNGNDKVGVNGIDTYKRMLDTNTIRVAYISYPPSFIYDPNTKEFKGIFYEVINEIAKRLNVKLEFVEETNWASMIETLRSNKVDIVVAGIWPTIERGKWVDFTHPLYYSVVKAYARADDDRFDNNKDRINSPDVTIAVLDGEMSSIIAEQDFPKAKKRYYGQLTDVSSLLLEVAAGKADITFVEPAVAKEFMAKNPGKIKEVNIPPLRVFPNTMMVRKGDYKFLNTINIAIDELINNGFVDRVIDKYEKYKGSFYRIHNVK